MDVGESLKFARDSFWAFEGFFLGFLTTYQGNLGRIPKNIQKSLQRRVWFILFSLFCFRDPLGFFWDAPRDSGRYLRFGTRPSSNQIRCGLIYLKKKGSYLFRYFCGIGRGGGGGCGGCGGGSCGRPVVRQIGHVGLVHHLGTAHDATTNSTTQNHTHKNKQRPDPRLCKLMLNQIDATIFLLSWYLINAPSLTLVFNVQVKKKSGYLCNCMQIYAQVMWAVAFAVCRLRLSYRSQMAFDLTPVTCFGDVTASPTNRRVGLGGRLRPPVTSRKRGGILSGVSSSPWRHGKDCASSNQVICILKSINYPIADDKNPTQYANYQTPWLELWMPKYADLIIRWPKEETPFISHLYQFIEQEHR